MDPLNPFDPMSRLGAQPPLQPLAPQEEDSLLGKIAGAGLGGLGYVGSVLEKTFGGRALRGALGGKPRELLSVLPFSDTLGITNEADRVSGKELLGMQHDDSWGATLGGLATELALDPGMYMSFGAGAIGKAGQVAKKIGALPTTATGRVTGTLDSLLQATPALRGAAETAAGGAQALSRMGGESLGGVVGLGLPGMKPATLLGTGQGGADFLGGLGRAAGALDTGARSVPVLGSQYGHVADFLGDTLPRYTRALFSPPAMGATSQLGQPSAQEAHALVKPLVAEYKMRLGNYGETLRQSGLDPTGEVLRGVVEGTFHGPVHPAIGEVAHSIRGDLDQLLQRLQGLGVDLAPLSDQGLKHLPRYEAHLTNPTAGFAPNRQPMIAADPRVAAREEILKGFERGTAGINDMLAEPAVWQHIDANNPLQAAAHIRSNYLNPAVQGAATDPGIPQSAKLVEWMRGLDPQRRAAALQGQRLNFFGNHPLADLDTYVERVARLHGAADATQNLLARTAELAPAGGQLPQGAKNLLQALEDVQLTGQGGQSTLTQRLAQQGKPGMLGDYYVPQQTLGEATRYLRGFTSPEAVGQIGGAMDKLTQLTKAWQTAPWPQFHIRNDISGLWQNWIKGGKEALAETPNAYRLVRGEVVPDAHLIPDMAARGLSPEQATREMAREMYAWGVGGHMPHLGKEVAGPLGNPVNLGPDLQGFLNRIPGYQPRSVTGALESGIPRSLGELNPFSTKTNSLLRGGFEMSDVVEGTNRGALYLSLRRQGYTPEAAAREVLGAHFDYTRGGKTDLEAKVLSRLVPFYTYARQNIPHQIEQLIQHPGGPAGIVARTSQDLRQQAGFLPDYLGSGLAIPVGGEDNGTQRYLTRTDLPPEQAFEMLHGGPRGMQNSLMSALSQLNPIIKAPLEYATGRQFFTGRDIGDLYSQTGSPTVDQVLANSPFSRLATTARTLADERKWESPGALGAIPLNLLTGAKVTDVDMAKQRNIAAGEYLRETLRGQPEIGRFESIYPRVPLQQLTPQEQELLRLNKNVEARAREAAKKRIEVR